jgi:hypothetical protein
MSCGLPCSYEVLENRQTDVDGPIRYSCSQQSAKNAYKYFNVLQIKRTANNLFESPPHVRPRGMQKIWYNVEGSHTEFTVPTE